MVKGILISIAVAIVLAVAFFFPGDTMSSDEVNEFTVSRAYLAKNMQAYAVCYNSVNYGESGLYSLELNLKGEYWNDPRVTVESLEAARSNFMDLINEKCDPVMDEYEANYNSALAIQKKSQSLAVGWRTFLLGGGNQGISSDGIDQYEPGNARKALPFNSYIYTETDAADYYDEYLGLN